ncbi:hypothetical protein J6590_087573 [Homalodisca vitripennis]|nr:hypothetical protein J6590_087573 [Homalodisca vitripennis]
MNKAYIRVAYHLADDQHSHCNVPIDVLTYFFLPGRTEEVDQTLKTLKNSLLQVFM